MGKVIYFDGDCNVCDSFVHWIYKRDRGEIFQFSFNNNGSDEIYLRKDDALVRGSSAVALILNELGPGPRFLSFFFRIPIVSNLAYKVFAKYRYLFFHF